MRRGHTREEVRKAYAGACSLGCPTCGHRCQVDHKYGHRFDCCGVVWIHEVSSFRGGTHHWLEQHAVDASKDVSYCMDRTPRTTRRNA